MEVDIIHLVVQLSRALGHPYKIYNVLSVAAPVIYIGPCPSHLTEILDDLGDGYPQGRVEHGEADKLAKEIRHHAAEASAKRAALPTSFLDKFSQNALLPKMISAIEARHQPAGPGHPGHGMRRRPVDEPTDTGVQNAF